MNTAERDLKFMAMAAQEAQSGMRRGEGGPFGAVILLGNKVISSAHNTVLKSRDATCHAEMNAIRKACRRTKNHLLRRCVVYTTTEPCPMCFAALHWAQVSTVYFSTRVPDVAKLGFNELMISNQQLKRWGKSPLNLRRVRSAACEQLLKDWQSLAKRRTY